MDPGRIREQRWIRDDNRDFGSLILGTYLDRKFGTGHKLSLLFLLIGIAAGFRNIYLLIKKNFPDDDDGPKKNIKDEPHRKRPFPKKT